MKSHQIKTRQLIFNRYQLVSFYMLKSFDLSNSSIMVWMFAIAFGSVLKKIL